jgi:hypothetical protein
MKQFEKRRCENRVVESSSPGEFHSRALTDLDVWVIENREVEL